MRCPYCDGKIEIVREIHHLPPDKPYIHPSQLPDGPEYDEWLETEARAYGQEQDRKSQAKKGVDITKP